MVKYILSLTTQKDPQVLPAAGRLQLKEHVGKPNTGRYLITASYTDKGGAASPLSTKKTLILRPSLLQAEEADKKYNPQSEWDGITHLKHRSFLRYNEIDLTGLRTLSAFLGAETADMKLSVRTDSLKGKEIALINIPNTGDHYKLRQVQVPLSHEGGQHNLFFIVLGGDGKQVGIDWMRFQ
jgi:cytochrome c